MMKSSHKNISNELKCAICYSDIKERLNVYQDAITKGIICASCKKKFAAEDIELIIYLLFVYGGRFGMHKKEEFSLQKMLEGLNLSSYDNDVGVEDINRRMMHKAILHGYTPKEYGKHLRSLLEES